MNKKRLITAITVSVTALLLLTNSIKAQNIGINATGIAPAASAGLDVDFTNKGFLLPRVALTAANTAGPIAAPATSLLVYNTATAGAMPNNVLPGYYYWNGTRWIAVGGSGGLDWSLLGNSGTVAGTNFIGTTDAIDWVVKTTNTERMRVLAGGNVGIGTTTPSYRLDLNTGTFAFGNGNVRTETRNDAGLQGNVGAQSGFFETSAPAPAANWPVGASGWWHLIDIRHSNNANNYALQIAGSFFDQNLYFRKTNGAANTAWSQLLTTTSASTGYIQNQFAGAQTPADHWVSGSSRASEVYAANWFRVDGGGGLYWQVYGGGWYMQDATWIRGYNGRSLWMGTGLVGGDGGLTIGYGGATPPLNGGVIFGNVGIGVNPPICKLHVQADGDNIPVIFGKNTNVTAGTTSFGVRGECSSTGLGSAGISGVSTNSSQNEIGVIGDYSLWGASVFGLAWAAAYTDMPTSRDYGVFAAVHFGTASGVYSNASGSAYAFYGVGNYAVTGTKSASVPTSKGNQLVYSTESPEMWFEDIGNSKLMNGEAIVELDPLFIETVKIDSDHPLQVFIQENGDCNGVYVLKESNRFIVKEKSGGHSNVEFSYRVLAKRRFYEDHRFGVDLNQPFGNNIQNAKYVSPTTQDPNEMKQFVERATAQKEAEYQKEQEAKQETTTQNSTTGAGENKLVGNTPKPEDPVLINKPTETKSENTMERIEKLNNEIPK